MLYCVVQGNKSVARESMVGARSSLPLRVCKKQMVKQEVTRCLNLSRKLALDKKSFWTPTIKVGNSCSEG